MSLRLATTEMISRLRFSTEQIRSLIKEVKKHLCLWSKEDKHYNKIYPVGMAWKTIASQLRLSENTVKLKWKNLRDTFNRILNKNPEYTDEYPGEWPYFNDMRFLIIPRPLKKRKEAIAGRSEPGQNTQEFIVFNIDTDDESVDILLHTDKYNDLQFLESLAPYFERLDPVRRLAMRVKIQEMLVKEIAAQNEVNSNQSESE